MRASYWESLAKVFAALAVGALLSGWYGYSDCLLSVSGGMARELNPLTEGELEVLIGKALAGVDQAPASFMDRAGLAHPVCYKDNSISDNGMSYALFVFLLILALFSRNQGRLPKQSALQGRRHGSEMGQRSAPVPQEIDVGNVMIGLSDQDKALLDAVGDVNVRDESLMIYLQRKTTEGNEKSAPAAPRDIDGFFCPPGYHDKPILYVDPEHSAASDELAGEDPVGDKDRPFATLGGGIAMARQLLAEGSDGVMLRIMPGVYHSSLEVPDKVVLCNHRLPAAGTPRSRLSWLTAQSADSGDSVTILAPENAQVAVQFEPGIRQGIFGCHIVGRESVRQAGIVAVNCRGLAIVNCSIEGFIGGGLRLQDAGTELPGGAVIVYGCRLHRNEARLGGAIYGERSSISVADSVIEHNKALTGGAIYLTDGRAPLFITTSRIAHNRAQLDAPPELDVEETELGEWQSFDGVGGGVYLRNSRLKISGAELVENGASVAGGGVALISSKAVFESYDGSRVRFARNRSRLGAGFAAIGAVESRATLKCSDALFEKNKATIAGGGFLALGFSTVQMFGCELNGNELTTAEGFGAGGATWMGGELLAAGVEVYENKSKGCGGGLAAVNARMSLKDGVVIRANVAGVNGGGLYAVSTRSDVARELVRRKDLNIPFAITLDDTKITNNVSTKLGGGLYGGNNVGIATLPIGFKLSETVRFQLNRTKSQKENGDDVWILWAGKVKGTDREHPEKLVLR